MTIPLARFLTEFTLLPAQAAVELAVAPQLPDEAACEADRHAAELAAARAAGHREGVASAEALAAARETALQADHAAALEAARQAWVEAEGAALAASLNGELKSLEARLAATAAALLAPLLPQAVANRTVADFKDAIGTLLVTDETRSITVSGRSDLVEAIRRTLAPREGIRFEPSEDPEVKLTAGDTDIRSSLQPWADRLAASIGPLA